MIKYYSNSERIKFYELNIENKLKYSCIIKSKIENIP